MGNLRRTCILGLVLAVLLLGACVTKGLYPTPDAYVYYGLGLSLAQDGHYGNPHWLGRPAHVKYPPLYPVMLAGVESALGGNVLVMNALGALLLLIGVWAFGRRLSLLGWNTTALLLAGALVIGNRYLQNYSWGTTSDVPFLGMIGLVALAFPFRREVALFWWPLLGVLLSVPALGVRLTGIVLLCALALHLLAARRWREALLFGSGCAVVLGAWILYTRGASASTDSYASAVVGGPGALQHAWMRLTFVLDGLGRMLVPHADRLVPWPVVFRFFGAGALLLAFLTLLIRRPAGALFLGAFLAGNILLILATGFYDHQRYLFPLFLMLVFVLVRSLVGSVPRWGPGVILLLLLLFANLGVSAAGAWRSFTREVRTWNEPAISRARVEASGAAQFERKTILSMLTLAEEWRGEDVALVQCLSLRDKSYAPLLLPGRVGWRTPSARRDLEAYFSSAAEDGRVYVLGRQDALRETLAEMVEAGSLMLRSSGQQFFTVYEYR